MTKQVKTPVNAMFPFVYTTNDYHDFADKSKFLSKVLQEKVRFRELAEGHMGFLGIQAAYAAMFYVGKRPKMAVMKELLKTRGPISL